MPKIRPEFIGSYGIVVKKPIRKEAGIQKRQPFMVFFSQFIILQRYHNMALLLGKNFFPKFCAEGERTETFCCQGRKQGKKKRFAVENLNRTFSVTFLP